MLAEISNLKADSRFDFWFEATAMYSDEIQEQLYQYYQLLVEYNQVMNLTAITEIDQVYEKHFFDSLTISSYFREQQSLQIADLGCGAGFPGLVLAIIFPQHQIYLIEPLTKRCKFLAVVVKQLQLTNVTIINQRAEAIKMNFDYVVSRAVAKLNILLELAIPLVKVGGTFIALKGSNGNQEIIDANKALRALSAEVIKVEQFLLPVEKSARINVIIKKTKLTNAKYPRNFGQIKKKPL